MRNEHEKNNTTNYSHLFALVLVAMAVACLILTTMNSRKHSNLDNFQTGLALGHLVGYLEMQSLDYDEMDKITVKYDELKSASSISEAQEIANEMSILIQDMYNQLEEDTVQLEKESELMGLSYQ